jgi:hypothetical protein
MARPRYRLRTWIRAHLPKPLYDRGLASKGRKDCRQHHVYNYDSVTERCYRCEVGSRPYDSQHFAKHDGDDDQPVIVSQ